MRPPREIMEMDLSQRPGNPTSELQAHAQELWAIQDPQELANAAISIVKPLVGRGMSQKNYQMFLKNMRGAMRRGLTGVQTYITNYILKGSGMGRDQEGGRTPAFGEGMLRILANSDVAVFNEALRAFGLKIVGRTNTDPLRTQARNEDIVALASTITEDVYTPVELSIPTKIAKKIAEEAGFVVAIIENDDEFGVSHMAPDVRGGFRPLGKNERRNREQALRAAKPTGPVTVVKDPSLHNDESDTDDDIADMVPDVRGGFRREGRTERQNRERAFQDEERDEERDAYMNSEWPPGAPKYY